MNTELLASFLEMAQRLHFGHAAGQLGLTQPALSLQIQRLEREVGAPLFKRTSREVQLTQAGEALVPQARRVIGDLERAIAQCRAIAAGGVGHLKIASIGAALNSVTPGLVRGLLDRLPGIAIELMQLDTPLQLAALRAAEIDLGVVRAVGPVTGIELEALFSEPMVLAVHPGHRLADAEVILPADLRDERFILWPRSASPLFHDQVLRYCDQAGFSPQTTMEGADVETQLGLVSVGIGISPQPASFANLRRAGVVFKPLLHAPSSTIQLAWLAGSPPVHLDAAIAAAHESQRTYASG